MPRTSGRRYTAAKRGATPSVVNVRRAPIPAFSQKRFDLCPALRFTVRIAAAESPRSRIMSAIPMMAVTIATRP
jgi:hypothetical protein